LFDSVLDDEHIYQLAISEGNRTFSLLRDFFYLETSMVLGLDCMMSGRLLVSQQQVSIERLRYSIFLPNVQERRAVQGILHRQSRQSSVVQELKWLKLVLCQCHSMCMKSLAIKARRIKGVGQVMDADAGLPKPKSKWSQDSGDTLYHTNI
jgi:hypothetical protein